MAEQSVFNASAFASGACCPNGTERGCPTRSNPDCQMSARNSTGFGVVEQAAAETATLRRLQNDLGNTPLWLRRDYVEMN
jgi:hypothetical protein